jgi:hypothetical protein
MRERMSHDPTGDSTPVGDAAAVTSRPFPRRLTGDEAYNVFMDEDHDRVPGRSSIDDIIELYKKDVDRTLLREALKLTPDQRVRRLVELTRFAATVRDAKKADR